MKKSLQNDPNQKMYCFFEFLKPGRHNYCISHNDPEPSLLNSNQQDFYVHDVVANVRDEIIPSCKSFASY